MLAAFFLTLRLEGAKTQSFLFYASLERKMIPTIKTLNQRSNLNLLYHLKPPKHKTGNRNACSIFLTQRREGSKFFVSRKDSKGARAQRENSFTLNP